MPNKENINPNEVFGGFNNVSNNRDKSRSGPYQDHFINNVTNPQLALNYVIFYDLTEPRNECQTSSKQANTTASDHIDLTSSCTPNVEITGERIFAKECNLLSNQAHIVYNRCLKPTSADARLKSHVTSHAVSYHAVIVNLTKDDTIKYNIAINLDKVRITLFSLDESFKVRGRVDLWTMNGFCWKLGLDAPPNRSKKNYFFSFLVDLILCNWNCDQQRKDLLETVEKSFEFFKKYFGKCDLVFLPCLYQVHWFVFVVDFPAE